MSLISRVSRLSYGRRVVPRSSLQSKGLIRQSLITEARRFGGGHGPPTKLGFPHMWGGMVWVPSKVIMTFSLFIQFQMIGLIVWYKWDSIPYPAHRYNDEYTTARNY